MSFAIGNITSGATGITACGSALQTAAKIYTTANTLIGFGAGATHTIQGKGQFGDYISVASGAASAIGWIGGKLSGVQNCFVAGTEVLVGSAAAPGVFSEKQIEDIRVGDEVWSKDQNNPASPLELKKVKQVFVHTAYDLQKVNVTDETGNVEVLDVTDEHPFYVEGIGWVTARELVIGEHLISSDGKITTVTANVDDQRVDGVLVYNFEVEGDHTYFVADGQGTTDEFVWVHNTCGGLNHLVPVSLGSEVPRGDKSLTYFGEFAHTYFHSELAEHLKGYAKFLPNGEEINMFARKGNPSSLIKAVFSASEREQALQDFYKVFRYGGKSFEAEFLKEFADATKRGLFK